MEGKFAPTIAAVSFAAFLFLLKGKILMQQRFSVERGLFSRGAQSSTIQSILVFYFDFSSECLLPLV